MVLSATARSGDAFCAGNSNAFKSKAGASRKTAGSQTTPRDEIAAATVKEINARLYGGIPSCYAFLNTTTASGGSVMLRLAGRPWDWVSAAHTAPELPRLEPPNISESVLKISA